MKVFWLRLLGTDFVADGDEFVSGVIDVYENTIFRNLSVTRSRYGTDLLGNNIWTGLDANQAGDESETGKIVDGDRWLDTSGRIDIINFRADNVPDPPDPQTHPIHPTHLTLYHSDLSDDSAFRDEWASFGPIQTHEPFNAIDLERNVKFVISDIDSLDDNAEFLIRVEIGKPTMAPFYRMSKEVLNRYPEWMEMRELHNEPDGETATPDSLGGQFVNAIAGEWLDDIRSQMKQAEYQLFIDTVDLDQTAWVYETEIDNDPLWSITGDGVELARAADWAEFLESPEDADVCFFDYEQDSIFSRQKYDDFQLNEETVPQSPYHVWNFVDELGALVDLERLHLETNEIYRWRILDVYRNHPGGGRENLLNALRRELNLWYSAGISPDPQEGYPDEDGSGDKVAVPELLDMQDILNDLNPDPQDDGNELYFFNANGTPTNKFTRLVRRLSWEYPATWGRFQWDRAIWDPARDDFSGFSTTPDVYDGEQPDAEFLQHGVGDMDDLKLVSPTSYIGAREFTAKLIARGFERVPTQKYLPVQVDLEIYGEGLREEFDNPTETVWFSLEADTPDGIYVHSFQMSAKSDASATNASSTPDSYDDFDPWDDTVLATRHDIDFIKKDTQTLYDETGQIPFEDINSISLIQGRLVAGSYGYQETTDDFTAWFSSADGQTLTFDSGPVTLQSGDNDLNNTVMPLVIFRSEMVNSLGNQVWRTDSVDEEPVVNDAPDHESPQPVNVPVPSTFTWGNGVTNRNIVVQLRINREEVPGDNSYGALVEQADGSFGFIDSSHITINGNNSWSSDGRLELPEGTSNLEVSVDYTPMVDIWEARIWESNIDWDGIIDRVGPWYNGQPQNEVGAHTRWITIDQLTRDNFENESGDPIPHNEDYVVTRMRAEVSDQSVGQGAVVWLNSQIVESDADFRTNQDYPSDAIREYDDDGTYRFDPFVVHARLVRTPNEDWNPFMRSGFFFDGEQEFYIFADEQEEVFTQEPINLSGVAHQGAPVIVQATDGSFTKDDGYLAEVAFPDDDFQPTLMNTEIVQGTGGDNLILAYSDFYNATVEDPDTGDPITVASGNSNDNILSMQDVTDVEADYLVKYNVYGTYIIERFYWDTDVEDYVTRISVDPQASSEITEYTVTYEGSARNAYTPAEVTLNPMRTITNEGYIFIGRDESPLDFLFVEITPSKIIADGEDYIQISIQCFDEDGNPKPDQQVSLSSTFGTFNQNNVTVDRDGFVMVILTSEPSTDTLHGELTVESGQLSETLDFDIEPNLSLIPRLYALPTAHHIEANGQNTVTIFGRVMKNEYEVAPNVDVDWRQARHLRALWAGSPEGSGTTTADSDGRFTIGPFTVADVDDPGYWFVAIEAEVEGELVGDVVFWFEYAVRTFAYESVTNMPIRGGEFRNPPGTIHPFANEAVYPYGYDEEDPQRPARDNVVRWLPPSWFPLPKYQQYQLGLFAGNDDVKADSDEVIADSEVVLADSGAAMSYTTYVNNMRPYVQSL